MKKDGFVSIDAIFVSVIIFSLIALFIGLFTYIYPTFNLQREINVLTKQAQLNGGLTYKNVSDFKSRLNAMGFIEDDNRWIQVEGRTTPSNYNIVGVNENNYISMEDNEIINLIIKVPSNNKLISLLTHKDSDYYIYKASVLPEKY